MKSLKQQIQEKYLIDQDTICLDKPEIGETAWDYNGEAWEILDYCKIKNKADLKNLIRNYDYNGVFKDLMNDKTIDISSYEYAVAAEAKEKDSWSKTNEICVWLWGYDGLSYYNDNE